jgi:hypothetical protein
MGTRSWLVLLAITATLAVQGPPSRPPGHRRQKQEEAPPVAQCPQCGRKTNYKPGKLYKCRYCQTQFGSDKNE